MSTEKEGSECPGGGPWSQDVVFRGQNGGEDGKGLRRGGRRVRGAPRGTEA